jgi:SAM-dependent methyltransferase
MSEAPFSRAVDPYDQVPYRDYAFGFTHPRHLEAVATLFGMVPPDATQCRVLELGSASGGNLIPQALELPESFFVGMDLSERQVNAGRAIIEQLRLKNIELRRANILQVDDGWGRFDYIIAHGVFSWVPREVREKVLEICSRNLAPNGVAIVSYNTYPGWHFKNLTRELMLYHSSQFEDPREQIGQALAILEFLVGLTPADSIPGRLFREQLEELRSQNDPTYVFHEYLEQTNEPIYFHHFIQRAEAHGLAYLAEAEFWRMLIENLPPQTHELFRRLPLIRQEQYLDFIRARAFRRTLLCHRDIGIYCPG